MLIKTNKTLKKVKNMRQLSRLIIFVDASIIIYNY